MSSSHVITGIYFYRNTNRVIFDGVVFVNNHAGDGGGMCDLLVILVYVMLCAVLKYSNRFLLSFPIRVLWILRQHRH